MWLMNNCLDHQTCFSGKNKKKSNKVDWKMEEKSNDKEKQQSIHLVFVVTQRWVSWRGSGGLCYFPFHLLSSLCFSVNIIWIVIWWWRWSRVFGFLIFILLAEGNFSRKGYVYFWRVDWENVCTFLESTSESVELVEDVQEDSEICLFLTLWNRFPLCWLWSETLSDEEDALLSSSFWFFFSFEKKKNERNGECDLTRATLMWQIVTFFVEIRGCLLVFDDFEFFDSSWSVFLISFPLSWKTMIWMKIWFGWVIFKFWDEHLVMNEVPLAYCCHLMNQMIVMSLFSIFVVCFA